MQVATERAGFVRRRIGERYNEDCLLRTVKHPQSVMLWSCITTAGPGPLYFVQGSMNQQQYKTVLEGVLLPYINELDPTKGPYVFMHDGAPCHRAKSIKNYLSSVNLRVLKWPGNSPDLNPIENVWNQLKKIVYAKANPNKAELMKNLEETWRHNDAIKETIQACIMSMPKRIKQVIKVKGGITKY